MANRKAFMDLTPHGKRKRLRRLRNQSIQHEDPHQCQVSSDESDSEKCDVLPSGSLCDFPLTNDENTFSSMLSIQKQSEPKSFIEILDNATLIDSDIEDNMPFNLDLEIELRNWCIQFKIAHVAISALLCILRSHKCHQHLPCDARTFLQTPKDVIVQNVSPGLYSHIGIANGLKMIWKNICEQVSSIDLLIGIDGLPLFNSTSGELWPILASVLNIRSLVSKVFPIGIYYGPKKPESCTNFLQPFVTEIISLINDGIVLDGKQFKIVLKGLCCDAPAKAFVLGVKSHTGYFSCTKCKQEGKYLNNRMTFPEFDCVARTNAGFLAKEDEEFHKHSTPLTAIPGMNFVSSVPLDYMHLVCLGVLRTFMYIWVFAKAPLKFPHRTIESISSNLLSLKSFIPNEFCRKPRSLGEIKRWKATEFRQFLIYTGPLVLSSVLLPHQEDVYNLFLSLHVSLTILLSPMHYRQHNADAKLLLIHFAKSFQEKYGQQFMTHNVHGLTHLAEDALEFGPLDLCSAFQFENFLCILKRLVRKGDKPLQQVAKRIGEMLASDITFYARSKFNYQASGSSFPIFASSHCSGPLHKGLNIVEQFKSAQFELFKLTTSLPNNCCQLSDGAIVLARNFAVTSSGQKLVICERFQKTTDLYTAPCPSSAIGINVVGQLADQTMALDANQIVTKLVYMSLNGRSVVVPLLHQE